MESSALALKAELEQKVRGVHIMKALVSGEVYFRVRVGNFTCRTEAQATVERLVGLGYQVLTMESAERPCVVLPPKWPCPSPYWWFLRQKQLTLIKY